MTDIMDKFFVRIGFKRDELEASHLRGFLYVGIVYMIGLSSAFLIMTAIG